VAKATLIDTTKCIGCRSCQVTCKQWNQLPAEKTSAPEAGLGLQNPKLLSAKTLCVIQQHEVADDKVPGGIRSVFAKRQCMHCDEPACAAACPVTAMHKTDEGPVAYDPNKCIGCRYCLWACPWGVPTAEWDKLNPKISKCDMCYSRLKQQAPTATNGVALSPDVRQDYASKSAVPSCVKQCPAGALKFGDREALLAEARDRMKKNPGKYVDHIYGEHEAGGTGMLYMASVPFADLGFADVKKKSYVAPAAAALSAVPPAVIGVGAALGGITMIAKRREEVAKAEAATKEATYDHHVEFAPLGPGSLQTTANKLLLGLMGFGAFSFLLRFILGLGTSTNLSDTYAWGLWIVFDLVWIAVAAGAFATAGLIYVLRRKDLYSIGRSAVLMGLLSYSFVTVTLLADLGMPWHAYQLAMNAPHHSAMFEVSWCVGLYVTILLLEFLPVALGHFGLKDYMEKWQKYAPMYVVFAVTLFVFLLSHKLIYTLAAMAVFGAMAYAFRTKGGEKPQPIMLAIAAVTLSTMHQSSLGSLFLLMPDKLSALWWSPIMPVYFFLSSIAAGTALIVLLEMWIAKAYRRQLRTEQLASLGGVAFWSLLVYELVRAGDLFYRGQLAAAVAHPNGYFLTEMILGGMVPLVMLATPAVRRNTQLLFISTLLACCGVILNRMNVVLFGMTLHGPMPQTTLSTYMPSIFEWGISVGLIATTVFLFSLGARYLPILPKEEQLVSGD
jgi:formate dehydrogenase iron-sulfur subunit